MKLNREKVIGLTALAGGAIVAKGTATICEEAIKNNTPEDINRLEKFYVWTAGALLTGLVVKAATKEFSTVLENTVKLYDTIVGSINGKKPEEKENPVEPDTLHLVNQEEQC